MRTPALILNIIMIILFIPSAFSLVISPFLFDSGATKRTWTIFITVVALPVLIIITQIISWIAFSNQNFDLAFKVSLIPLADLLFLAFLFIQSNSLT